jgi:hypothetical protein
MKTTGKSKPDPDQQSLAEATALRLHPDIRTEQDRAETRTE